MLARGVPAASPAPPKLPHHLIEAALDAVGEIFVERHFADKVIERRFRATPQWGSRDRRLFAETVYDLVRWWRWLWHLAGLPPEDYLEKKGLGMDRLWLVWAAYWVDKGHELPRWPEVAEMNADKHRRRSAREVPAAVRNSIPDWLDQRGAVELGDRWPEVMASLNEPAPVFLRANALKAPAGKVCHLLIEEGFECATVPGLPEALRLAKRQNVFPSKAFKEGLFEVQDAGSQRIAPFLQVEPGMRVVDACAGAGGKSLHLAALMHNKGRIVAMDTVEWKLKELRKRAARANAQNLEARLIEGAETIKRQHDMADRVLLDVPCSGLGVMRRNPDAKWKLHEEELLRLRELQGDILREYSKMVKPGGKLVYATCSIFRSENEDQVQAFLSERGEMWTLEEEMRLYPGDDGGDGFYAARLARVASNP
jgi:16S rRNA (cytosine967-C5)-methyltransferase